MKRTLLIIGIMATCFMWFIQAQALAQVYPLYQTRAGEVAGKNVFNDRGQFLGNVADVIAGPNGEVRYLVISNAFGETPGTRLIPVPWSTANARVRNDRVLLDLPVQALLNAPYWQNGTTPYLTQQLESEILNYFGIPYGEQGYYGPGYDGGPQYYTPYYQPYQPYQQYEPYYQPYYYGQQPREYQQQWNGGYYGEPGWVYPFNEEEEEERENSPYGYGYFPRQEEQGQFPQEREKRHENDWDRD